MPPELEALIRAYDAAREARDPDASHLRALFEIRLRDVLAQHPEEGSVETGKLAVDALGSLQRFGQQFQTGPASELTGAGIKTEKVRGPAFCSQRRV